MIKISDHVYIAAEQVAEVSLTSDLCKIYVKTKARETHSMLIPYGQMAFQTLDKLVAQIDEELK